MNIACSEIYYEGMIRYEQIIETLLVNSQLSEETQIFIQEKILDEAQRQFELEVTEQKER